jgi:hypothetical protein
MFQGEKQLDKEHLQHVSVDKRADILQATFKHYYDVAMDHHTKAATISSILLILVAAIIGGVVGHAGKVGDMVAFGGGLAVFLIGVFGAVWAWKQHERYHYWQHIAYEYQNKLKTIVPGLKTGQAYYNAALEATVKEFGSIFAKKISDRYLWVSLHSIVAAIGFFLMVVSMRPV